MIDPTPAQSDEILRKKLLQYTWPSPFPQHSPPIEVVFTNGMKTSDNDREHYVFSMPYATFSVAIEAIIAAERQRIFDAVEGAIGEDEEFVYGDLQQSGRRQVRAELRAEIKRLREGV